VFHRPGHDIVKVAEIVLDGHHEASLNLNFLEATKEIASEELYLNPSATNSNR
jgi:hypothetical protein